MATIRQWLIFAIAVFLNVVLTIVAKVFGWIPGFYTLLAKLIKSFFKGSARVFEKENGRLDEDSMHQSFSTFAAFKRRVFTMYIDVMKTAEVGGKAPNTRVLELGSDETAHPGKERRLLDFQNDSRPLVVLFGNVTCGFIRAHAPEIGRMKREFTNCDFIQVYTSESHAKDEWYMGVGPVVYQHKAQSDKLNAAQIMVQQETGIPVVCDLIAGDSECAYGAANCRVYVIRNGIVEFATGIGPFGFDMDRLRKWLEDYSSG